MSVKQPQYVPITIDTPDGRKGVGVAKATTDPETGVITLDMRIMDGGVVDKLTAKVPGLLLGATA